jgi:hypothetical protein
MDGTLAASCSTCSAATYTAFAVHVLECQSVGAGRIFKASVSALNPVSGARDAGHLTFYNSLYAPSAEPEVELDVNGNALPLPDTADDGYVAPYAGGGSGGASSKGSTRRVLQQAGGGSSSSTGSSSTIVYDAVVVPGESSSGATAVVPGSSNAPLTNPSAVVDIFGIVLSAQAQLLLVQSAVIIVGSFLLSLICGVI